MDSQIRRTMWNVWLVSRTAQCKRNLLKTNCFACSLVKTNFCSDREPQRSRATALTGHLRGTVKESKKYKMLLYKKAHPLKMASTHLHLHSELQRSHLAGACFVGRELSCQHSRGRTLSHLCWCRDLTWSDLGIACIMCWGVATHRLQGACVRSEPPRWLKSFGATFSNDMASQHTL